MSVFDLLRRFFEPPGMRDPFFGRMAQLEEEDEDDEDEEYFFGGDDFQSSFGGSRPPFHDPFGIEDIFRDFNELFGCFGSVIRDIPRMPGIEPPRMSPEGSRGGSLRDSMLRFPDSHLSREQRQSTQDPAAKEGPPYRRGWLGDDGTSGGLKQDEVLDSEVSSHGLDSVLAPRQPSSLSIFRSVSVSKVMRPDGTVEERRTVRDSRGNATTTVTVTRGGEVISSGSLDTPRDSAIDTSDSSRLQPPDLPDPQTVLSRILRRWFSNR